MKTPIYLDYNATAPLRPQVIEAMQPWLAGPYNPSSLHAFGQKARGALESARKVIADAIEAEANNVIFTASATEANNHVLQKAGASHLLISAVEHPAVLKAAKEQSSTPVEVLPVDANGRVRPEELDAALATCDAADVLVSIMLANNETGVIQPIAELVEVARKYGAMFHCDAVQGFGKIPVSLPELGADFLTLAGHKMGGPVGTAALVLNGCRPIAPLLLGGGQELNRRAGTENLAAIVGFAKAVELMDVAAMGGRASWRDAMESAILSAAPNARILGGEVARLPNTSCVAMPFVANSTQLMHCDLNGVAVSSGSACTSGKVTRSHVLNAMGVADEWADCALRVSFGWNSTQRELERFAEMWIELYQRSGQKEAA